MLNILIVEDQKHIRKSLVKMIKEHEPDFSIVTEAENGIQALELTEKLEYHIIMTDIRMPDLSGLEMIKLIKEKGICSKFIIFSGHDEFSYAREAIRYGVIEYMLKPLEKEDVKKVLDSAKALIKDEEKKKLYKNDYEVEMKEKIQQMRDRIIIESILDTENITIAPGKF